MKAVKCVKFGLFAVVAIAAVGFVVMHLWNWLVPVLFGWHTLTFLQAMGLLALCKILFGAFHRGGCHGGHWRRRVIERWEQMTPEEKQKFREGLHC